jgi:hypothetical protein
MTRAIPAPLTSRATRAPSTMSGQRPGRFQITNRHEGPNVHQDRVRIRDGISVHVHGNAAGS